jgi:hypothetical protein
MSAGNRFITSYSTAGVCDLVSSPLLFNNGHPSFPSYTVAAILRKRERERERERERAVFDLSSFFPINCRPRFRKSKDSWAVGA